MVSGGGLASLKPALCKLAMGPNAADATFLEGSAHVTDTAEFVKSLAMYSYDVAAFRALIGCRIWKRGRAKGHRKRREE